MNCFSDKSFKLQSSNKHPSDYATFARGEAQRKHTKGKRWGALSDVTSWTTQNFKLILSPPFHLILSLARVTTPAMQKGTRISPAFVCVGEQRRDAKGSERGKSEDAGLSKFVECVPWAPTDFPRFSPIGIGNEGIKADLGLFRGGTKRHVINPSNERFGKRPKKEATDVRDC
jgi:hypothetical protein